MMIECPRQRTSYAFVILGRSGAKRRADPRIHAVTSGEGSNRRRTASSRGRAKGAVFRTVAEHRGNGMDPRVCAASLRSLLRPRMTKKQVVVLRFAPAILSPAGRGEGER
ncbi:hypothetical protein ASE05_14155 [Mesorhizobium sp. Root172]|uniref:Uncharacterized protein n=1 Tax=Rhizobium loti TaxID=381 RepID=A0AA91F6H4_RHILI|nr:hypothetical protein ASE05_14155 [Mesorhizobium sp. Root172]OBQ67088.1 hypothetical protein A8145_32530 [Mesorhizobium loti]